MNDVELDIGLAYKRVGDGLAELYRVLSQHFGPCESLRDLLTPFLRHDSYDLLTLIDVAAGLIPLTTSGFTVIYNADYESKLAAQLSPARLVYDVSRPGRLLQIAYCPGRPAPWVTRTGTNEWEQGKTPAEILG